MPARHRTPLVRLVCALAALALVPTAAQALPVVGLLDDHEQVVTSTDAGPIHWSFESGMDGWEVMPGSYLDTTRSCRGHVLWHGVRLNKEGNCFLTTWETSGVWRNIQDGWNAQWGNFMRGVTGQGISPHFGVIESPRFTLTHPTISMLVAGGEGDDNHVAVCAVDPDAANDCREVGRVGGDQTDWFAYKTVHLPDEIGQEVFLRVVDRSVIEWSHIALDNVRANAPAMPRSFSATHTDGLATISWDAVDEPGVVGYDLYRRAAGAESDWPQQWEPEVHAEFVKVNEAPITAPGYLDDAVDPDRGYWYKVAAVEDTGLRSEANMTYLRPALDPGLHEPGEPSVYSGAQLSGVAYPVGPIGYGGIVHLGDGVRNLSWIFNVDSWTQNANQTRRHGRVPHSFFAVRAAQEGAAPVVRALQTVDEGPFEAVGALTFSADEPIGRYTFSDDALPVSVAYTVESPTTPGNLRDSAIPTAIYTFELANPTDEPVAVSLLASQQNAVGFDGQGGISGRNHPGYGDNTNELGIDDRGAHLQMTGCAEGPGLLPVYLRCNGGMALSMLDPAATGTASWGNLGQLRDAFAADGAVTGPSNAESPSNGVTVDGALTTTVELAPGETRSIPVVFSWYIPTSNIREDGGWGAYYANVWGSAREVHAEVLERLDELLAGNREYQAALYDSNLPRYVLERMASQVATLRSPTVFWAQNDYFGGWEGHGCCPGMPPHVWQYAQLAPRLWPEIDTRWQSQWLDRQMPDGHIPFRHVLPLPAVDGQAGVILGSYRHYLTTGDDAWLLRYWIPIKRAMDYLILNHDPDRDGVMIGSQPMTLDQRLSGTSSWLGSMYLAALAATANMAEAVGIDLDAQLYRDLFETGRANQEELLWNGEYFAEAPDPHLVHAPDVTATSTGTASYGNGLIADMLLGQWWADQLGLGDIYDPEKTHRALGNLYEHNFKTDFMDDSPFGQGHVYRPYVRPTDAGLKMMTWPGDDRPEDAPNYHDEVWTGQEYSAAAAMIRHGLLDEGLRIVRAAHDRHDGELRTDLFRWACGTQDGGGNPFGDDECGKWYSRAMSNWSVLLALQGFSYDAAGKTIGFAPRWQPDDHRSFFTAGNSWGTFTQQRDGDTQTNTLAVRHGTLELDRVELDSAADHVEVSIDGLAVAGTGVEGTTVLLPAGTSVAAGQTLHITLERD